MISPDDDPDPTDGTGTASTATESAGDDPQALASASPTPAPPIDVYETLLPPDRAWLRGCTDKIQSTCLRMFADFVTIGNVLIAAKDRIGHGKFAAWIRDYLPWDVRTAQRLMQVATTFPHAEPATMNRFETRAVYYLAQTTTPPEARAYAVQLATDGERVTLAIAKGIVAAQRTRVVVTAGQVRKLAVPIDREAERAEEDDRARANAIGVAMLRLLATTAATSVALHLRAETDENGHDCYVATLYPPAGVELKHVTGAELLAVLRDLAGDDTLKRCAKCGERKAPNLFAKDALQRDGLNRYCKACERVRYSEHKRRQRELKAAQNPSES